MQNFIELYELLMPVNSSLRNASIFRKYPKHQNVRSPPKHFAIGYVHNDNLPWGNIALQLGLYYFGYIIKRLTYLQNRSVFG